MKQLYFLLILTLSFGVYSQGVFTYNFDAKTEEGYTLGEFNEILATYKNIGAKELKANLFSFVARALPSASLKCLSTNFLLHVFARGARPNGSCL